MTRSMTTVERYIELRSRLEELDRLAEHVPPAALAERLVEIVGRHMERIGSPVELGGIRERVGKIANASREPHGPLTLPFPLGGDWLPPPGTKTIEIPGEAGAPVEEGPHEELLREGSEAEEMNERQETEEPAEGEPEASGEPKKPCKDCGVTKALSEFPKSGGYKDGHTNVCKPCTKLRRKKPQEHTSSGQTSEATPAEASANGSSVTPISEATRSGAEASLCANGDRCAAVHPDDPMPQPAILDEANQHPSGLCRRCQLRAGVA